MRLQQARLEIMAFAALNRLISYDSAHRLYQDGVTYGQQLLSLEPTREESHRELMRLLALSGQRSAALEQFEKCRLVLAADELEPGQETARLAEQIRDDLLRPQPAPSHPIPNQQTAHLQPPPDPTHFVNREALLLQLKTAIATGSNQRLAVVGMGGIGKTSFVIHLAHQVRDQFADGVLWADVSHDDPIGLIDRWAEAYGCDFRTVADETSRAAALRDILKDKRALLILDDVDHLAKVRPLIPDNFPGTVLLTTRDEDVAFHLQAQKFRLEELAEADGLALLRRVVGEERVQAEFAAANQLCALLQNLPLALNITAQRLALRHQMYLRDMVARLRQEKSRLAALDEQDQAVRASFLVSWRALDDKQKRTFALMGLFAGRSFTVDALTAIAGGDPYETEDQLYALNALSLVAQTADGRYRQHTLLAEFARDTLADPQTDRRLAEYYLAYAQEYGQNYNALRPEWENLMAGMETAYKREMWVEVLGYSQALTEAWFARGRYTEARQGYEWAVAAAESIADEPQKARNLFRWAQACLEQSGNQQAEQLVDQSVALFRQQNDLAGQAAAQNLKASLLLESIQNEMDYHLALNLLTSSQSLYAQIQHENGESDAIHIQARAYYLRGDYEKALELAKLALQKRKFSQDKKGQIVTLRLLGQIVIGKGNTDWELSTQYRQEALSLSEELQDQGELALSLNVLATALLKQGRLSEAEIMLERSMPILRRIGAQRGLAMALLFLCQVKHALQKLNTAWKMGNESLTLSRKLADPLVLLNVLVELGDLHLGDGRPDHAQLLFDEGYDLAVQINHPGWCHTFQIRRHALTRHNSS